jgi:hypothetical protein
MAQPPIPRPPSSRGAKESGSVSLHGVSVEAQIEEHHGELTGYEGAALPNPQARFVQVTFLVNGKPWLRRFVEYLS